jgi:hypothetical protein
MQHHCGTNAGTWYPHARVERIDVDSHRTAAHTRLFIAANQLLGG